MADCNRNYPDPVREFKYIRTVWNTSEAFVGFHRSAVNYEVSNDGVNWMLLAGDPASYVALPAAGLFGDIGTDKKEITMAKAASFSKEQLAHWAERWLFNVHQLDPDSDGEVAISREIDRHELRKTFEAILGKNSKSVTYPYSETDIFMNKSALVADLEACYTLAKPAQVDNTATTPEEPGEGDTTMSGKLMQQAEESGRKLFEAGHEGLNQAAAKRTARLLVSVVRSRTGEHHPALLNSPAGRKVEPMLIAAMVHGAAGLYADKIPKARGLQRNCERVVTAEMAEVGEDVLALFEPFVMELANIAGDEEEEPEEKAPRKKAPAKKRG